MAIKFEKIQAGMVLYQRGSHKMGSTMLRTKAEWPVSIVSVDGSTRRAEASWNCNAATNWRATELQKLYDWSMYDEDDAIVVRGMADSIISVTRRKPCPRCKARHASAECPPKKVTP